MGQVSTISIRGDKIRACSVCGGSVSFVNNRVLFGEAKGVWPYIYLCNRRRCGAYVGCAPRTDNPLGTMADAMTRRARQHAHRVFDALWKKDYMTRRQAYIWLTKELGISKSECHIGMFTVEQCEQTGEAVKRFLEERNNHAKSLE